MVEVPRRRFTVEEFHRTAEVGLLFYGRHGVPEAWPVDLGAGRVGVYREPSPEGYCVMRFYTRGEPLAPLTFPDREVPTDDLLGEG